jgi:hypothetical protein
MQKNITGMEKVNYTKLNARQKEIYNFQKVSAVLADYGYVCIKLSDDRLWADFIAMHMNSGDSLKIQLKSRLTFAEKYEGKEIFVFFSEDRNNRFLYSHDDLLDHRSFAQMKITTSYKTNWSYSLNKMTDKQKNLFEPVDASFFVFLWE